MPFFCLHSWFLLHVEFSAVFFHHCEGVPLCLRLRCISCVGSCDSSPCHFPLAAFQTSSWSLIFSSLWCSRCDFSLHSSCLEFTELLLESAVVCPTQNLGSLLFSNKQFFLLHSHSSTSGPPAIYIFYIFSQCSIDSLGFWNFFH